MKRIVQQLLLMLLLAASSHAALAQGGDRFVPALQRAELVSGQRPTPYPNLRESDIVWMTNIWKSIDLNEAFNQYLYFPTDSIDSEGRINLADLIWNAVVSDDDFPIYDDDALTLRIENELFVRNYTRADTIRLEIGYDDDDNELYETYIRPKYFVSSEVTLYNMREVHFIGKADTRMDSRRLSLAIMQHRTITSGDGEINIDLGLQPLFWVPMQHPKVRQLLVSTEAHPYEWTTAAQPSFDNIFVVQYYNAYITRESNIYERKIMDYLTGEDAILQSEAIEDKLHAISDDMWEY